jgi:hypothetical protein
MAEKANTWVKFIEAVYNDCHGVLIGWHGLNIAINLEGLLDEPLEKQVAFLIQMSTRGLKRVVAEQVSATAIKTVEEATARATYRGELGSYQAGTRVGVARIDSPEKAAESLYLKNLTALLKDNNPAAMKLAGDFGLSVSEKGRLVGADSANFQNYVADKVATEYWANKGTEEFRRLEQERAAKVGKKAAEVNL